MKTITHAFARRWLGIGTALLAALAVRASTDVTFTIDMNPSGTTPTAVYINGSFNGWGSPGSPALTNNGANVWSQTVTITDPVGTVESCKFNYDGNWENAIGNRQFLLGAGTQVLPQTSWDVSDWPTPSNPEVVTFQVDMSALVLAGTFTPGSSTVTVAGDFESSIPASANWDNTLVLTNNPNASGLATNIYSGTWAFDFVSFPPVYIHYKFRADGGYESPASTSGQNRYALMTNGTASNPQVLPVVYYSDLAPNAPTNQVTFQVDMTPQVIGGSFVPGVSTVTVSGGFEGWDNLSVLTNDPTLTTVASNIYSGTFPVVGYRPVGIAYKFRMNGGWEQPISTGGTDRHASITNASQILPLVYYGDVSPYDLVQSDTTVTFTLYMPNGTQTDNGGTFAKGVDQIFINGDFLGWWSWGLGNGPAQYQMTQVGSSDYYTNIMTIPRGNSIYLTYKYSVDGADNENGANTNHVREIRNYGPEYTFPVDRWSWSILPQSGITTPGTNGIVELDFGYLSAGKLAAGKIPVTWWGRPGVILQNKSSLSSGLWNDNPATDGTMSTNWPNGGTQFFRLKKK